MPRRPPPRRREQPTKPVEYDFDRFDYFVLRCFDRNRIQRFETLRTAKGESPFDKHCPRCGKSVDLHVNRPRQLRPDRRYVA